MSTRATYTFKAIENYEQDHTVYVHHDGYPSEALLKIKSALAYAWDLPRYESDEFAASFVAANKSCGGGVRLMKSPECSGDAEYDYEVWVNDGVVMVQIYHRTEETTETGTLRELISIYCDISV